MEPNVFDKVHDKDLKKTMEKVLYRLCHECNCIPCPAGCPGRIKTGSAPCAFQ